MKHAKLAALLLLFSMIIAGLPAVQPTSASTPFTETFTGYVSGSNALWWLSFNGINATSSLAAAEASPGLLWYNLSAIRTTTWVQDFQLFGPGGYNLLPVPFIPTEGLFITVGAANYQDAATAARAFGIFMVTSFTSFSNGTGSYTFYSPLSFTPVIASTMLRLLPTKLSGFATAISRSIFPTLLSPMVTLGGVKAESGFARTLALGSITSKSLSTTNKPNFLAYFGGSDVSINASKSSALSVIHFKFLDGIAKTKDSAATVVVNQAQYSSEYTLVLSPGKKISGVNITVSQVPQPLIANRVIDAGTISTGQNVSISVSLFNPSNTTALKNVTVNDNWWVGKGFRLVSGNASISVSSLSATATVSPTYVLQYIGNESKLLTVPRAVVKYAYIVGGTSGVSFPGHAVINPIQLSLGMQSPVLFAYATPVKGATPITGEAQTVRVWVSNVGSQTASAVQVSGQTVSGIIPNGKAFFDVPLKAPTLISGNATTSFSVTYKNLLGTTLNASTNFIPIVFSHASMSIGYVTLTMSTTVSQLKNSSGTKVSLAYSATNAGAVNATVTSTAGMLPSGVQCGASGSTYACSAGTFTLNLGTLVPRKVTKTIVNYTLPHASDVIFPPVALAWTTSGFNLTGSSDAVAVPAGLSVTKSYSINQLFPQVSTSPAVHATNAGPLHVYNITMSTPTDVFAKLVGSGSQSKSRVDLGPGESYGFNFTESANGVKGNFTSETVSSTFFFAGRSFSQSWPGPRVTVYDKPTAAVIASPLKPQEGRPFSLAITLSNPGGVPISQVEFVLPIPIGVTVTPGDGTTVSSGSLHVSVPILAPHAAITANATAVSQSGVAIPFDGATLKFVYGGSNPNGAVSGQGIIVGENVTSRYLIPTALMFVVLLGVSLFVRRMARPTAPSSPR